MKFNPDCRDCPRLADFLDQTALKHPHYHARPVAPFGDRNAQLLIVGLAPGMHGANASGRPFTGDYAGDLLYPTLLRYGFAEGRYGARADDGLNLADCRITNAVRCVPPANKPVGLEIKNCQSFLQRELASMPRLEVIVALGLVAHKATLTTLGLRQSHCKFIHAAQHEMPNGLVLADSYHCSRYNTNTGRLTERMFHDVFAGVRSLLDKNL